MEKKGRTQVTAAGHREQSVFGGLREKYVELGRGKEYHCHMCEGD